MPDDLHERAKRSCVLLDQLPNNGHCSGYIIAPGRVATAWHGVKRCDPKVWYHVTVGYDAHRRQARVRLLAHDESADVAILDLEGCPDAEPLPVTEAPLRGDDWHAFGFPGAAQSERTGELLGLPIRGTVSDPDLHDFGKVPRLLLFSEQAAAGQATRLHGWSGSAVVSGGGVVGHLVRHIGDSDDSHRPAYGYVRACPISAALRLLDVGPVRVLRASASISPSSDPSVPLLAAWCDREAVLAAVQDYARRPLPHRPGLLCLVGHAENRQDLLMQRIADELLDKPPNVTARAIEVNRYFDTLPVPDPLPRAVLYRMGLTTEAELAAYLDRQGLGLLTTCYTVSCGTWTASRIEALLANAISWLDKLDTGGRRFLLTLVMQFERPTWLNWAMQRPGRVINAVAKAYSSGVSKHGMSLNVHAAPPIALEAFPIKQLRSWVQLDKVREGLGPLARELEGIFSSADFDPRDRRYAELVNFVERRLYRGENPGRRHL